MKWALGKKWGWQWGWGPGWAAPRFAAYLNYARTEMLFIAISARAQAGASENNHQTRNILISSALLPPVPPPRAAALCLPFPSGTWSPLLALFSFPHPSQLSPSFPIKHAPLLSILTGHVQPAGRISLCCVLSTWSTKILMFTELVLRINTARGRAEQLCVAKPALPAWGLMEYCSMGEQTSSRQSHPHCAPSLAAHPCPSRMEVMRAQCESTATPRCCLFSCLQRWAVMEKALLHLWPMLWDISPSVQSSSVRTLLGYWLSGNTHRRKQGREWAYRWHWWLLPLCLGAWGLPMLLAGRHSNPWGLPMARALQALPTPAVCWPSCCN